MIAVIPVAPVTVVAILAFVAIFAFVAVVSFVAVALLARRLRPLPRAAVRRRRGLVPAILPAIGGLIPSATIPTVGIPLVLGRASLAALPPPATVLPLRAVTPVARAVTRAAIGWRLRAGAVSIPRILGRSDPLPVLSQPQDLVAASPDPSLAVAAKIAELGPVGAHLRRALAPVPDVALRKESRAQGGPPIVGACDRTR